LKSKNALEPQQRNRHFPFGNRLLLDESGQGTKRPLVRHALNVGQSFACCQFT
jgi:hypothetical protein